MTTPKIPATAAADEQPVDQHAEPSADGAGTGGSRLTAVWDWLDGRAGTGLARVALLWFRGYFGRLAFALDPLRALRCAQVGINSSTKTP